MTRHWVSTKQRRRGVLSGAAAIAAAAVLAACGSTSSHPASSASGIVTGSFGNGATFTADFNPYSPSAEDPTFGMIYEPLMFFDTAKAGTIDPWLALSYAWSNGGKSLTFQLRHGVKWNDGKAFTSADVAYTFNLEKSNAALNNYGLPLAGATTSGPYTVTVNFTRPVYTDLYYIAGKVDILPQHIWSKITDPTTWTDPHPVGTGAYMVSKVNPQVLELTANPHYYISGLPKVKTYEFLTYSGNTTGDAAVESGSLDWAGDYIPNVTKLYTDKNKNYKLVDIPEAVDFLIPNMVKGPTTSLAVREAISDAIDRSYISQSVYNGYAPPSDPAGLLLPNYDSIASSAAKADTFGGADPAKSKAILKAAGYKMGSNGIFNSPTGQPLNIDVKVVTGYTDYDSILQILQPELKAAGINLTVTSEAYSVWSTDQDTGNFQLLISNAGYTPIPYSYYYSLIDSAVTKPIGTSESVGDYGRYSNPTVNSLLNTIAATTSTAAQDTAFSKIESIFAAQLPDITLFDAQDEIEFNGNSVTGFPTTSNAYAGAAIWLSPDNGWVAARMAPAK
jgi:peptide/nickel transport system substrate-binding protein